MKAKPSIHARDHRRGGEDPMDTLQCYETTLTNVSNTVTPTTFLSFTVPANDIHLGEILYIQWTFNSENNTGGPVQPTITLVFGTSADTFTLDGSQLATWATDPNPGSPEGAPGMWGLLMQRQGDASDETDTDGSFFVMNPAGVHPTEAPSLDVYAFPRNSIPWDNVDFTVNQLVEVQISWDVADPTVLMFPYTATAERWC